MTRATPGMDTTTVQRGHSGATVAEAKCAVPGTFMVEEAKVTDPGTPNATSVVTKTVVQSTASGTGTALAPSPESSEAQLKPPSATPGAAAAAALVSSPWGWWRRWSPWSLTWCAATIAAPSATSGRDKVEAERVASA